MKTIQQAAQFALDIQNASNWRGVLHSFKEDFMPVVTEIAGKDWLTHPVTRLVFAKVVDLQGYENRDIHAQGRYLTGNPFWMAEYTNWNRETDEGIEEWRTCRNGLYDRSDLDHYREIYDACIALAKGVQNG